MPEQSKSHRRTPELLAKCQKRNAIAKHPVAEQNPKGRVIAFAVSIEQSGNNVKIVEAGLVNRSKK